MNTEEKETSFKERIKNSFYNVKEDILAIKEENKSIKDLVLSLKNELNLFKKEIDKIRENLEKKEKENASFFIDSIGNKGVNNNQQQSTTINNNQQQSTTTLEHAPFGPANKSILDPSFLKKIENLTDREFSVFIAVYDLTKEKEEVTYTDLADKLRISEGTVRFSVNRLISKGMPLIKERLFNKKSSLFLNKDLFDLNILPKLISVRQKAIQKTLFSF